MQDVTQAETCNRLWGSHEPDVDDVGRLARPKRFNNSEWKVVQLSKVSVLEVFELR